MPKKQKIEIPQVYEDVYPGGEPWHLARADMSYHEIAYVDGAYHEKVYINDDGNCFDNMGNFLGRQ